MRCELYHLAAVSLNIMDYLFIQGSWKAIAKPCGNAKIRQVVEDAICINLQILHSLTEYCKGNAKTARKVGNTIALSI